MEAKPVRVLLAARDGVRRAPPRILVAEDDLEMRTLIVEVLWGDGYDVISVGDGGSLLERVREQLERPAHPCFHLLISDVRMPIAGGLRALEALRRSGCEVHAILMTAFGDEVTRRRARELRATFLEKPFALDELRKVVFELVPIQT